VGLPTGPMLAGRLGGRGAERVTDRRSFAWRHPPDENRSARLTGVRARDASAGRRRRTLLHGGTLAQLLASLGYAPFAFDPPRKGYVLLLEEVGERPYRLDRMVTQLIQTGPARNAHRRVVICELPTCDEPFWRSHGARG